MSRLSSTRLCPHSNFKHYCRLCSPQLFCQHDRLKKQCKHCDIKNYLFYLQAVRISTSLRDKTQSRSSTKCLLGCSKEDFHRHIEEKFKPGMTWDNIEIDHIKPISWFDLRDENEVRKCFHWTNTQPLFRKDNRLKKDKWTKQDEKAWQKRITSYHNSLS